MSSAWADARVLVTGATGMVGSALTRWLIEHDAYVVAFVLDMDPQSELLRSGLISRSSVVNGKLEDYASVERAIVGHEVDTVFHVGAQTIVGTAQRSPRATFESNIQGTWNVLDACRVHSSLVRRVVVASSDKAYGEQSILPYVEDMPLAGRNPYEVSKSCADLLTISYAHSYGLPAVVARCGNIYGPGDLNWSRIVPGTFRSILTGQRPVLRSDGTFLRDYVHLDDVVSAYVCLAENADVRRGEAFNFSDEHPMSVMEIYRACCAAAGQRNLEPEVLNQAAGEIRDQYLDSTKARKELAWAPTVALGDGLARTFEWYQQLLGTK